MRQMVRAMERRLHARLDEAQQERARPVNYRSLALSTTGLAYVDLGNHTHAMAFQDIVEVDFVREEAMFPCLDGPYLETKWMVRVAGGEPVEVMDEAPHRKQLLAAFAAHLPGFDSAAATAGLRAKEEGRWVGFRRG